MSRNVICFFHVVWIFIYFAAFICLVMRERVLLLLGNVASED